MLLPSLASLADGRAFETGRLGGGVGNEAALAAALAQLKAGLAGAGVAAAAGADAAAAGAGVAVVEACVEAGADASSFFTSALTGAGAEASLFSAFFSFEEAEAERSIEVAFPLGGVVVDAALAEVAPAEADKAGKSFSPLGTRCECTLACTDAG